MKFTRKQILIAAATLLAPAASALAATAQTDPFAGYERGIAGIVRTPALATTPASATPNMTCGRDPFEGTRRAFNTGGPAQWCATTGSAPSSAQAPSGKAMPMASVDAFQGYKRGISGG